jgi:hypothetical protein
MASEFIILISTDSIRSLSSLSSIDFSVEIWPLLNQLIPQAVMHPQKCEETLNLALVVFRKLADTSIESVDIERCLLDWGTLLVEHKSLEVCRPNARLPAQLTPSQVVGRPESIDMVSHCLSTLLYWCATFAKASQRPLPPRYHISNLPIKQLLMFLARWLHRFLLDICFLTCPLLMTVT